MGKSRGSLDTTLELVEEGEGAGIGRGALGGGEPSSVTGMVDRWEENTFSKL